MATAKNDSPVIYIIRMDGPLCEKDEQAKVMERMRKNQQDALKNWRSLKNKRK